MARIAFVIATLDRGGSESQLVYLATGLDRSRFDPVVICLTRGGPLESKLADAQITTFILHKRCRLDLVALRRLTELLCLLRPDLVHTWLFTANAYGRWAALRCGVPHLVASERSTDPAKPWLHCLIDRWLARRTDCIVANCQAVREVYLHRLGLPAESIPVIPNGLDLSPTTSESRRELREREGLPADAFLFVTATRLERSKAVDDVVRAFALVSSQVPQGYLLVAGDGSELGRLTDLAARLGVGGKVIFLGEVENARGVLEVVLEAMAAGTPVVATAVGGVPEVVADGQTGHLVPIRRPDELARRMLVLAQDRGLRERLGRSGRERVGEFTMERMVGGYEELYDRVLSGNLARQLTTQS
jgi:glycosyltransferase involved in cell wall biosynthesis